SVLFLDGTYLPLRRGTVSKECIHKNKFHWLPRKLSLAVVFQRFFKSFCEFR
ncbi:hypothetical protein GPX59_09325, partial [Streptococcus thermophilus]|nr:hypothetical protein [Streptococcus thermophilus]